MDVISSLRVFAKIAASDSISAVARKTGSSQSAVTRQIAALEGHLGVRLLQRTTRSLTLTEDGRELLVHANRILDAVEEAETFVSRRRGAPAGLVRIGVPNAFAQIYVLPRLPDLLIRYPELSVEFVVTNGYQDVAGDSLDLWIRLGDVKDSALITRCLGYSTRVTVSAASYLRRAGEPKRPEDLSRHECVIFTGRNSGNEWSFEGNDGSVNVRVSGRVRTDSPDVSRDAVVRGVGIGVMPEWMVQNELAEGTVRTVMSDWRPPRMPMHVVYPSRRFLAPRTRAVLDFLVEQVRLNPATPASVVAAAA
jgi:DNA-binding transcriptional LysR family regulator